jgi:hypothetical protein
VKGADLTKRGNRSRFSFLDGLLRKNKNEKTPEKFAMSDSGVCQTILKRKPNVRIRKRWTPVAVYYYLKKEPTSNKGERLGMDGGGW